MPFSNAGKLKKSVDQDRTFGASLTSSSKKFDYLDHETFIKNVNVCGFSLPALKLTHNYYYLSNRKQRTRVNSSYN